MPIFDRLYSIGAVRKALWKHWYPFLTWRLNRDKVTFLNYAFETDPPMGIPLTPADEQNRACIQLYHEVASQVDLRDKEVLEISCGHGGGASYLTRTFRPKTYVGLDLNRRGIRFCQKHHRVEGLSFVRGDAEKLPFEAETFDVVINVEASHCYAEFPRFLREAARVLRPGGYFLYADFRVTESVDEWQDALARASFTPLAFRDISADVLRGMDRNSQRSQELVARHMPPGLRAACGDFAGITGSRIYNALKEGVISYRAGCFSKSSSTDVHDRPTSEAARELSLTPNR